MSTDTTFAPDAADRAAYEATQQIGRDAATLLRHETHDRITFAADDPDLIVGMAVVKPGVFNGVFEVTRDDLDAWVARFEELRGTFRPPMRLDHGWSVTEVVGRFVDLRVENRPDESAGGTVVPMLVGDWRIVGTPAEREALREWIKGDKLNERSSEFWPYRTNTGAEYPSVFAGCAFVDIPAVEGLGAITLRRAGATLSNETTHPEGTSTMSDTTEQPTTTDEPVVEPETAPVVEPETPEGEVVEEEPAGIVIGDADDDDDSTLPDPVGEVPASDLAAALRTSGVTLSREQLAAVDAAIEARVALRLEADTRVAKFRAAGVMVPAIADTVEALLRHDDKTVRDGITAVLDIARPPVALGAALGNAGVAETENEDGTLTPVALRELTDAEELGKAWAALTTDQRKDPTYLAAYQHAAARHRA